LAAGIEPPLIVILSDINMPGMDGLSLLRAIKTAYPELPVMMVTAYGDDERRRLAAEFGAAEFLTKPVDFDFLKAQLQCLQVPPLAAQGADQQEPGQQEKDERQDDTDDNVHSMGLLDRCENLPGIPSAIDPRRHAGRHLGQG
jgi:DNA-binding NtrC family response regulator